MPDPKDVDTLAGPASPGAPTLPGEAPFVRDGGGRDGGAGSDGDVVVAVGRRSIAPAGFGERYAHERVLGEGGMGAVLLYHDIQIGRRVALKVMRADAAADATMRERFVREAQVQGQLEHPSIVPVYDLGVDPRGTPYFTMKRVRGVTLAEILDGLAAGRSEVAERYPRRRLLGAFASVCLAVDFAHRLGVLHRDLKPANLMLGDFGEVYVLDWGLAKVRSASDIPSDAGVSVRRAPVGETRAGIVLGTPGYMPPEQIRGETAALGPATDVYALGAILFEILAGEPLHPADSPEEAIASTLVGSDARPSMRARAHDVGPELDEVCARATAPDPRGRWASARELHDAVESWLGGERDVELRRTLANAHAKAAAAAAARVTHDATTDVEVRREAMREIGRALALDPGNADATRAMMDLLDEPPRRLPPEVGAALERAERDKTRRVGRFGAVAFASLFLYLPLVWWMGVRSAAPIVAFYVLIAAAAGFSAYAAASRRPPPRVVLAAMVASNVGCAITATFFGPLFFMPAAVAINTNAFVAHAPREHRAFVVAVGVACVVVPFALQALGVVAPSYVFGPGGMTIAPGAVELRAGPTTLFLALNAVAMVLLSSLSVVQIRDALGDAERRLMVHTWHMRGLAPGAPQRPVVSDRPPSGPPSAPPRP